MNVYEKRLKDHYHNPKNYGLLENPNFISEEYNPSCGDSITFQGLIENNILKQLLFTSNGCILSKATASLLTELCIGKPLSSIAALTTHDMLNLVGIPLGPLRSKCALLPLNALHKGILDLVKDSPIK